MTTTLPEIRRAMLDRKSWSNTGYGVLDSSDVRWIKASWLGSGGESAGRFRNRFVFLDEAEAADDRVRRADRFSGKIRRLYHGGPDYSAAPSTSATRITEVHRFPPLEVNSAINRGLARRCFALQSDIITTDGSTTYTLGTAPFDVFDGIPDDEDPDQHILDVESVSGSGATIVTKPWMVAGRTFKGRVEDGVLAVEFSPAPSGDIRVWWKKPYTALANDTATTTCPLKYAVEAAFYELYDSLELRGSSDGEANDNWHALAATAYARMDAQRRFALGEYAGQMRRIRRPRRFTASPRVGLRR